MVGVDVGSNLEDEARELRLFGVYHAFLCLCGAWRRSYLDEAVEQLLHTEVVESRTKEYWCHLCRAVCLYVELRIYAVDEFKVVAQLLRILLANLCVEFWRVYIDLHLLRHALLVGLEEVELLLEDVVHALELGTDIDRP